MTQKTCNCNVEHITARGLARNVAVCGGATFRPQLLRRNVPSSATLLAGSTTFSICRVGSDLSSDPAAFLRSLGLDQGQGYLFLRVRVCRETGDATRRSLSEEGFCFYELGYSRINWLGYCPNMYEAAPECLPIAQVYTYPGLHH